MLMEYLKNLWGLGLRWLNLRLGLLLFSKFILEGIEYRFVAHLWEIDVFVFGKSVGFRVVFFIFFEDLLCLLF